MKRRKKYEKDGITNRNVIQMTSVDLQPAYRKVPKYCVEISDKLSVIIKMKIVRQPFTPH